MLNTRRRRHARLRPSERAEAIAEEQVTDDELWQAYLNAAPAQRGEMMGRYIKNLLRAQP